MIKRPRPQLGQIPFELPAVRDFSKPSVLLHKNGRYLLFKPQTPLAAAILSDLMDRVKDVPEMRKGEFWNINYQGEKVVVKDWKKIEIWRHLAGNISRHPLCQLLQKNGVEIGVVPTLAGYIKKEYRRFEVENTAFPVPAASGSASLFDRCSVGTNLRCVKNFEDGTSGATIFKEGQHYMVVASGGNGLETVAISRTPITSGAEISSNMDVWEWSEFTSPLEEYFDDSEDADLGLTVTEAYPDRVARMSKQIDDLGFDLFEHVKIDAAMEALKRSVVNGKLMRMGKAQPLDAELLTPSGWASMGDIQVGDEVFGEDGLPHKVTGIYPQGKKTVYRVIFSDRSSTECCDEHLWKVYTAEWKYSGRGTKVLPLSKLKDRLKFSNGITRYYIPLVSPIQFKLVELPVDPYLLGCLLGDGTIGLNKSGYGTVQFSSEDQELLDEIESRLPGNLKLEFNSGCSYRVVLPQKQGWKPNPLSSALSKLDLRHKSNGKWIPNQYKFSSVEQRLELLRGLMDTDGSIWLQAKPNAAPIVEFTSVSEKLCDDVAYLVQSFGGITTKDIKNPFYYDEGRNKVPGQTAYRVRICMPAGFNPFKLKRKAALWQPAEKFKPSRGMVKVEEIGKKECQCIAIDSENHLYVTNNLILTHNTSEAITVATLRGSKKIAVFGSKNVCITWKKELNRLGITDYVMVDRLADLEKPARFYLMRYGWIRGQSDPTDNERYDRINYLRAGERSHQVKTPGTNKSVNAKYSVLNHHPCPHCGAAMVRPLLRRDSTGKVYRIDWTPLYGYMCRNKKCKWTTDNRKKKGAAWCAKGNTLVHHKGGTYIDWGLAAHANCTHENIRGRQCMDCKETDGIWVPQVTKRFKKKFTAIIPDEVHNMKDPNTLTYRSVTRMRARLKYAATGTFISNGPTDAYWIFHWMFGGASNAFPYHQTKGQKEFEERFCEYATLEKPAGIDEETGEVLKKTVRKRLPFLKNPSDWWKFISPKFLRRNYNDPLYEQSLADAGMFKPEINVQKLVCPMTPQQIKLMLSALRNFKDIYEKHKLEASMKNREVNKAFVISQMSTMCTIATVPEAINAKLGVLAYEGPSGGGKMYNITTLARNRVMGGGKVLILSDYVDMQKALEKALTDLGLGVIRFRTNFNTEQREDALDRFANDPDVTIMVAGTRAVSESLDFSAADTCICCDLLWAPAFQQQAWSRILQAIKRQRICDIFLVLSANSIDEHKYDTFYAKLVASEQSQDRRVVSKKAMMVDIKWFADRVIEEEANLSLQIRDLGINEDSFMLPEMETSFVEARMV